MSYNKITVQHCSLCWERLSAHLGHKFSTVALLQFKRFLIVTGGIKLFI